MAFPQIACGLPVDDRRLLERARNAKIDNVLLGDGVAEGTLSDGASEFSVSSLALDVGQRLLIAAESVDMGPKAEAFRLRVFGANAPFSIAMHARLRSPAVLPTELDLAALTHSVLRSGVLKFKRSMTVEIIPGMESRIEVIEDEGLIFFGSSGAVLLVEHDHEIPLNLRITTSPKLIERSLTRAFELTLL